MTQHHYGYQAPFLPPVTPLAQNSTVQAGAMGLMIGGVAAAAKNLHAYKDGDKTRAEAAGDTVRTALIAATAAAMADAVAGNTGRTGVVPTLAALTTGTAVMYLLTKSKAKPEGENA